MHIRLVTFLIPLLATLAAQTEAVAQRSPYEQQMIAKLNQATIGVAAGRTEGAPLRFVTELARVVDDDDNMRVLPIVTRGPFENVLCVIQSQVHNLGVIVIDVNGQPVQGQFGDRCGLLVVVASRRRLRRLCRRLGKE